MFAQACLDRNFNKPFVFLVGHSPLFWKEGGDRIAGALHVAPSTTVITGSPPANGAWVNFARVIAEIISTMR